MSCFAGPLRASPAAAISHTRHGPVRGDENTTRVSCPRNDGSRLSHKDDDSVSACAPDASIATTVQGCWRSNHKVFPSFDHAGWPRGWNDALAGRHGPSVEGFPASPRVKLAIHTFAVPVESETNASHLPSGENAGADSCAAAVVRRSGAPPPMCTHQRSPFHS